MDTEMIRELLRKSTPFDVNLTDGRKFRIPHPGIEHASMGPRGPKAVLILYSSSGSIAEIINANEITSISIDEAVA